MEVPQGHEAAALMRPPSAPQNKPPANARPWPGGVGGGPSSASSAPPPPPKVYRVEPREFRDLVQKLTGAPPTALRRHQQQNQRVGGVAAPPVVHPQTVRAAEQQAYGAAPWFSFPMSGGAVEAQPQHGAFL